MSHPRCLSEGEPWRTGFWMRGLSRLETAGMRQDLSRVAEQCVYGAARPRSLYIRGAGKHQEIRALSDRGVSQARYQ